MTTCKKCKNCSIEKPLSSYYKHRTNLDGYHRDCSKCFKDKQEKYRENNKVKIRVLSENITSRYNSLLYRAKKADIYIEITKEQYKSFTEASPNCFYCDISMENTTGSGLNREDSSKGYVLNNIKRCCGICNKIMSNFSKEELVCRVFKIIERMK